MESRFVPAGGLKAPGPIGRVIRILLGLLVVYALYVFVNGVLKGRQRFFPGDILFWVAVVASYYSLPPVLDIGYGLRIGDWARRVYVILLSLVLGVGYLSNGEIWSSTTGLMIYGLVIFVFVQLGPSFLLSGVLAVPG